MFASLDVGTNTIRLLLGIAEGHRVLPHRYLRRITRLGGGYDPSVGLSEQAMERTLAALKEFSLEMQGWDVRGVAAIATEAVRRAPNASLFLSRVRDETGFALEVIPGDLEARLSSAGVLSVLDPLPRNLLIFDIGGGSTEFIYVIDGTPVFFRSYPLGTVMLCEHHPGEVAQQAHIDRTLRQLCDDLQAVGIDYPLPPGTVPVGTAGTVTTLAAIDLEMEDYDWSRVNNHGIGVASLYAMADLLIPLSVEEREEIVGMEKGRGDLIVPGLRIVQSVLDFCGGDEVVVSDFGLLEGALLKAAGAL